LKLCVLFFPNSYPLPMSDVGGDSQLLFWLLFMPLPRRLLTLSQIKWLRQGHVFLWAFATLDATCLKDSRTSSRASVSSYASVRPCLPLSVSKSLLNASLSLGLMSRVRTTASELTSRASKE